MLTSIIEFSVRNKLIIGLMVLALIGIGSYQATQLPIDAVPDITNNQVQVITIAPAFGATDIERLVTFPIEQANNNIAGLKEIRSFSRFGLSLVTIVFDDATDVYWARQQVSERLQQVQNQIPKGIGQPMLGPVSTGLGEIYQYVLKPKKGFEHRYHATELRTIQDWIVRRQLLGVKGVAEVSSFGGKLKQYEIAIEPNKLNAYGVTIRDVFAAIETNNDNTGGAYIEKGAAVVYIRTEGLVATAEEIGQIALPNTKTGMPLFIRDVATVRTGFATRYGAMCYNDQGEVAGAVVMMLKGANSSAVIKEVKARVEQIKKTLPEGVEIEPFLDRTKMVNNAISTVEHNLLEGALIVVLVLVLFLGNWRAGFLVASVIPLAMLFAICMMNIFGVSGNLMSLGALDFGLIVDGAVIIVESVMHQLVHSKKYSRQVLLNKDEMDENASQAASKMMNSAVFGQIIILIVYLPIFTLQGIEGKMFKPMAQTVAFALVGAFLLSLTYIPMMSAFFLSNKIQQQPNFSDLLMRRIERIYQLALKRLLRIPKTVLLVVVLLFTSAVWLLAGMGGEFMPALEEGDFAVETKVLTGSNLGTTIEQTQKAAHLLLTRFPEVEKVVTKIGSGEVPTDPMPMDASDMMVILKDKKNWVSAKNFPELSAKMNQALADIPGITFGFQFPVQMRFNELMTGARQDVVCKIYGENLDSLAKSANQLAKIVANVLGAIHLYVEPITGMPQIVIHYNRNTIAQYHVNINDINQVVNMALAGQSAGMLFEGEKRFDLVIRLAGNERKNVSDIQHLLIPTPSGVQIPLSQLATVALENSPNQIQREDAKRRIIVGFNVQGRDVQSIVQELAQKVERQMTFPTGYYVTYGGAFENLNQAKARLLIAVPVSLLLIFVLLFFAFRSVKQGLLIYSAIPLSAIGGVYFLAARGMPFSISAGIGFIALFGVAVLNGIVLIAEFNRLKEQGIESLTSIVLKGTQLRLRPVLMTAFVASLGFLPMAMSNGAGAEVQRPLATVVIGGLMIATLLTLFVLPILYVLFEKGLNISGKATPKMLLILVGTMGFFHAAEAQEIISLEKAMALSVQSGWHTRTEQLQTTQAKTRIATALELPKTNTSVELGQINSVYNDSKWSISQSMAFPTVYRHQKKWLTEEWKAAQLHESVQIFELKKMVVLTYYQYLYLLEKKDLLIKSDSLFRAALSILQFRLEKGDIPIQDKLMAENQLADIELQLSKTEAELEETALSFQWLLHQPKPLLPQKIDFAVLPNLSIDSTKPEQNPMLQWLAQQKQAAVAEVAVEKSKLLPDFTLGYSNNSFIGTGADNKMYSSGNRFSSFQVGVGFGLFTSSQKAKVKAMQMNEQILNAQYNHTQSLLLLRSEQIAQHLTKVQKQVANYSKKNLANAELLLQTTMEQMQKGSIGLQEFILQSHQSIATQNNYIELLKDRNEQLIQLAYLTTK